MNPTATEAEAEAEGVHHVSVIPLPPPPSYAEASQGPSPIPQDVIPNVHAFEISHRFPAGLFVLRNRSSLKVLDVFGARSVPGTPVIAYRPKRPTLVNGDLFHKENNQLFFIDWHGCLCSASSGLRVDVEGYKPVLSTPRPISSRASRESHPPVHFKYDPVTRTISVVFLHDPTYADPGLRPVNGVDYLLEVEPQPACMSSSSGSHNKATFPMEKISEWLPFGKPASPAVPTRSVEGSEDLDPDLDDSAHPARDVRVVSIAPGWREKFPSSGTPEARKWHKRQWDIASIVVQPVDPLPPPDARVPSSSDASSDAPDSPLSVLADLGEALGDLRDEIFRAFTGPPTT